MDQELQASDDLEIQETSTNVTPTASPEEAPASLEPIAIGPESVSLEGVDAELIAIKSRLREAQLLPDSNAIKAQTTQVQAWMASLLANGTWGDIAYGDKSTGPNWLTTEHLKRVLAMAQLYSTPNHTLYQHPSLREKIVAALNLWLASDFQNPNWLNELIEQKGK